MQPSALSAATTIGVVGLTSGLAAAGMLPGPAQRQAERLAGALRGRLKREVRLHCRTDAGLIGGAIVRAGDLLIDGSLKGKLARLEIDLSG